MTDKIVIVIVISFLNLEQIGFMNEELKIHQVGIIGAGMMGAGIAYVSVKAGLDVVLKDLTIEAAQKGKEMSSRLLDKKLDSGLINEVDKVKFLNKIKTSIDYTDFTGCELVIEAVFEDRVLKRKVIQAAEEHMSSESVFASNTSTLPITGLAKSSLRPSNFIGLHFFSPVHKMPLVEVIVGKETSRHAIDVCLDYVKQIQKTPIVVNDGRGFFTSRVFKTYLFEGLECLAEGVSPLLIEASGTASGMPVGPLAVADEVSIELMYKINKQTENDLGIKLKSKAIDVVNRFIEDFDRTGRKGAGGFYEYPKEQKKYIWPELTKHYPLNSVQPSETDVQKRLLYIQAIESVKTIQENIITNPKDADVGSVLGIGFPPATGGVISFVETIGISQFIENCKELSVKYGSRFDPPELLIEMAAKGKSFYNSDAE